VQDSPSEHCEDAAPFPAHRLARLTDTSETHVTIADLLRRTSAGRGKGQVCRPAPLPHTHTKLTLGAIRRFTTLSSSMRYRGTSPIRKHLPHQDHQRTLGIGPLQGPTEGVFIMSEVPL
jgi:hypothetical protein